MWVVCGWLTHAGAGSDRAEGVLTLVGGVIAADNRHLHPHWVICRSNSIRHVSEGWNIIFYGYILIICVLVFCLLDESVWFHC